MMIFWWQGKGWKAAALPLGVMSAFGLIYLALGSVARERLWVWGIGLLISAWLVWRIGSADNAKAIGRKVAKTLGQRLFYKPRNRFMSLPTETWAIPLTLAGVYFIASDLV